MQAYLPASRGRSNAPPTPVVACCTTLRAGGEIVVKCSPSGQMQSKWSKTAKWSKSAAAPRCAPGKEKWPKRCPGGGKEVKSGQIGPKSGARDQSK